jgi:hypothetical protein
MYLYVQNGSNHSIFWKTVFYKQILEFHRPSKFLCQTSGRQNHLSLLYTVKEKGGNMIETKPPKFKKSFQKPENSQDYGQKPQLNCTFMNSASVHLCNIFGNPKCTITQHNKSTQKIRHLLKDITTDFLKAGITTVHNLSAIQIFCRYMYL